jgi:26S proteasome regulatory subunit T3
MATNRADTLDPALLRPGRLDRKIEFPLPDRRQKRLIFATITGRMNLSDEVDLEDYVARPDRISGADINAICQEVSKSSLKSDKSSVKGKVKSRDLHIWLAPFTTKSVMTKGFRK